MAHSSETARLQRGAVGRPLLTGNMLGVASMVFWAAGFPAAERLLVDWPPLALISARFAMAVAFLVPLWMLIDGPRAVFGARWGRGTLIGGIGFGLGAYLLLLAQSLTDPVTVALIASATPIAATLIEVLHGNRRLTRWFTIGLGASVLGGVIATNALAPADLGVGALAAVGSCFLFAFGSFLTVRDLPELSPLGRSTVTLAGGLATTGITLCGLHLLGADVLPNSAPDGAQLKLLVIYAFAGMALSQVMFIASVGHLGIAAASFHINLAPFYVMLILLALGGGWHWPQAIGALAVAAGVVIAQREC